MTRAFRYTTLCFFRVLVGSVLVALFVAASPGQETPSQEQENSSRSGTYTRGPDFCAVAMAFENGEPLIVAGQPVVGYAWHYDTAGEAARAAEAYCRQKLSAGPVNVVCRIVRLGDTPVDPLDHLARSQVDYERRVLARLEDELALTGRRDVITQLSTIYQKIGRYDASEALLYDLAFGGEHLAQNALAYHWAELRKRLPEALALADAAVSQDPEFFSYHDTRGLVLARLERLPEAEAALRRAVRLEAHPIALDHLGDILWLRHKPDEAREQWRQAQAASRNILFVQRLRIKISRGMTGDIVFE